MKPLTLWCLLTIILAAAPSGAAQAQDPITEVIRQAVIKIIKAADLKVQQLQNKTIWLQNAQKKLENEMSRLQLREISGWVEQQRKLYADYFMELQKVKAAVSYYYKVRDITARQGRMVAAYKRAWAGVRQDKHFTPRELEHIADVYTGILKESGAQLEALTLVLQSFGTQMPDAARLSLIDGLDQKLQDLYRALNDFNLRNLRLSLQRTGDKRETEVVKQLYGIQ